MKRRIVSSVLFATLTAVLTCHAAGPPEENIRNAYRMLLSQADANKDGALSVAECMSIYKDPRMAEKNCTFWDTDKDGIIKEDEYVKQIQSMGTRK